MSVNTYITFVIVVNGICVHNGFCFRLSDFSPK